MLKYDNIFLMLRQGLSWFSRRHAHLDSIRIALRVLKPVRMAQGEIAQAGGRIGRQANSPTQKTPSLLGILRNMLGNAITTGQVLCRQEGLSGGRLAGTSPADNCA